MTMNSTANIIGNKGGLYEGNLAHYFKAIMEYANNLANPYHNFRHMFHVLWLCSVACEYYSIKISKRDVRNLFIAAMFHDFDHSGKSGNDDLNIELAIRGLRKHILPEDKPYLLEIEGLIRITEYPHKESGDQLTLTGQILQDADLGQALADVWIQQVVISLSEEWGVTPKAVLEMQEKFLGELRFSSEWAKHQFPPEVIRAKIEEVRSLLAFLQ